MRLRILTVAMALLAAVGCSADPISPSEQDAQPATTTAITPARGAVWTSRTAQLILSPATAEVPVGGTLQFHVTRRMSYGWTWWATATYVATGGTITTGGLYTAGSSAGTYQVIATMTGSTLADTSIVTVTDTTPVQQEPVPQEPVQPAPVQPAPVQPAPVQPAPAPVLEQLLLTPATASVQVGGTQQFSVSGRMSDGSTAAVTATYAAMGGTVDANGLFTAGSTAGTYRVIATAAGSTLADTSAVTVTAPAPVLQQLLLTPATASVQVGGTQQFSVSGRMSDGSTAAVTATYAATGGTISSGGLFTAGGSAGSYRVIATVAGGTLADTSAVTVTAPAPVLQQLLLTPATASVQVGGTQQFSVSGRMSDGSTAAVTATYAATGGTVTANGHYTAGGSAGSFRVIATVSGGTLADTSTVSVTSVAGRTYTTNFSSTENPISEGGNWINGGTLGLDWTNVSSASGLAIGHQAKISYTDATALLTGAWGPDQQVTATVHTVNQKPACYQEVEMRLRSTISAHVNTGYEISFHAVQDNSAYLIIVKWNGPVGSYQYIANLNGSQYALRDGDVISAKLVGNVITVYRNGAQMAQATDNTYTSGAPGMGFNLEGGNAGCAGTNGDYGYTSFTATDGVH